MIVKRYVADTVNEAMMKIKYDLGPEAYIISQRKIKKPGILGLFSKKVIEVTAAFENENKGDKKTADNGNHEMLAEIKKLNENIKDLKQGNEEQKKLKVKSAFKNSDLNDKAIKKVIKKIDNNKEKLSETEKTKKSILSLIPKCGEDKGNRIVLVGPTGVGKTTTLAKLAGKLAISMKKRVALVTIDTYRIGAVEQLKTYADIIKIPFKVVYNIDEMETVLEEFKDMDYILIDTTGRSSKNLLQLSQLRSFIEKAETDNINLVLSATTKDKDMENIISGYKVLNYKNLIITKLDETTTYGFLLNAALSSKKPIKYVTTGQTVPDDIHKISPLEIANLILGADKI